MFRPAASASRLALMLLAALTAHDQAVHGQTLAANYLCTLVLDEEGAPFGWGDSFQILGWLTDTVYGDSVGDAPGEMASGLPQLQSKLTKVTAVARGHACLVDATAPPSSAVQCWGRCLSGVCGHGKSFNWVSIAKAPLTDLGSDVTDRIISVQGLVFEHMCALFSSGRVKCWGRNSNGELGLGDTENRGDAPGEMGDNLPFVDLGTGVKAVQLAAGMRGTCVVLEGRTQIKCWGETASLGLGVPPAGSDLEYVGDQPGEMGDNLQAIDMGAEIEDIGVGLDFICVLFAETHEVKCWGSNWKGTLGTADGNDVTLANRTLPATLPAVSVGGRVAKLSARGKHTCVILEDAAKIKCWGNNFHGQLGLGLDVMQTGGMVPSELPDVIYGVPGETAVEISAGSDHTCVRLADGLVRCWGNNGSGQLGHGASYDMWGTSPDHMGANLPTSHFLPTQRPTPSPTASPTPPTSQPTSSPTEAPTSSPTKAPTGSPTKAPTSSPTEAPTRAPSTTESPTLSPSAASPTSSPTSAGGSGLGMGIGVGAAAIVALAGAAAYFRFGRSSSSSSSAADDAALQAAVVVKEDASLQP